MHHLGNFADLFLPAKLGEQFKLHEPGFDPIELVLQDPSEMHIWEPLVENIPIGLDEPVFQFETAFENALQVLSMIRKPNQAFLSKCFEIPQDGAKHLDGTKILISDLHDDIFQFLIADFFGEVFHFLVAFIQESQQIAQLCGDLVIHLVHEWGFYRIFG